MADTMRSSSFLPTIKCSMCARDIEISRLGEHVCTGEGDELTEIVAGTPPPEPKGYFDSMPIKQNPTNGPGFLKPGRAMPPRVDTSAANRPYLPQDQLTPLASPSRSMSPPTGQRPPFARPLRSATAPLFRRPPSPEPLSSNLDCAFPPFPTKASQNKPQQSSNKYAEADPMYAPVSPRTASSGGLLQRMNTIAPGPFDMNGPKQAGGPPRGRGHQRQATAGSLKDMTMSSSTAEVGGSIIRPATAGASHSRTSTNSSNESKSGAAAPRAPRNNGYGGFGPPPGEDEREPLRPEQRSQTFPLRNQSQEPPSRTPSEPGSRAQMRRPSIDSEQSFGGPQRRKPSISGPDLSRPLPPRGASLMRARTDTRLGDAPPVPTNVNLAAEFGIGNPYHTPTESQSSDASGYSEDSKASSRSSPPLSTGHGRSRRQPSDTTNMDVIMADLQSSMTDLQPRALSPSASPPKTKEQFARPLAPPANLTTNMLSPESPMDPAIQSGRFSPVPSRNPARPEAPIRSNTQDKPIRRPTTAKGNCKGCGEAIKGKSVSSADGRLTGRYHKHCFVCATCSEPFQASTFYVINDAPYCERHYHKLNGSMCSTCDKGIEGQYLETEGKKKYHPGCLTCADCKRSLRHDYFEMNGQVYCERDAFRRAQQGRFLGPGGGGSNRMERRTTRLMM
ncbi:Paxillin-like protein [Lachnellula suecica]|uniref:Paxillin-like protein n=1 Tax=Lachnellula suecica TaxID=602035 RepID=A0A8T9C8X7_9HELO|nr:Paxillin-like protein [Lachnellula suecica]